MTESLDQVLRRVAEETFEMLAFLIEIPEEFADGEHPAVAAASVSFDGPFRGALAVAASAGMVQQVAANMLGMDEEDADQDKQWDAFKELVNVVCGNLLPAIAGSEAIFNIQPPQLLDTTDVPEQIGDLPAVAQTSMLLDAGKAHLALYLTDASVVGNAD